MSTSNSANSQYGAFNFPPDRLALPPPSLPESDITMPHPDQLVRANINIDVDGYANLPVMSTPRAQHKDEAVVVDTKKKSLRSRVAAAPHPEPYRPQEILYDVVPQSFGVMEETSERPVANVAAKPSNYDRISPPAAQKTIYDAPESSLEQ
jgi:hypothetical protein